MLSAKLSGDDALFASATYLDDPRGAYDIDDVTRGDASNAFVPFPRARLRDRVIKGWFRFALRVPANEVVTWSLHAMMACDVFDVYTPSAHGGYRVVHAGMLVPVGQRGHDVPYPFVPLSADMAGGKAIYAYVVYNNSFDFGTTALFWPRLNADISAIYGSQQLTDRFFGGLLFAIIVTNLFLAFYLRDRTFFAYVAAMVMHVLTQFTQDGTSWTLFWPFASVPYSGPSEVVEALFFASLALFWRSFLNLSDRSSAIDRILLGFVGLAVVRCVLLLTLPQPGWLVYADFPLVYCMIVTALVAAISASRSGYRPARFLIVALAGLLFFWVAAGVGEFNLPDWLLANPVIANFLNGTMGIYYGVAWDALFLTFALADRIETAKRTMIAAQQETLVAQAETVDRLRERDAAVSRFLPRAFLEYLGRSSVVDLQLGDHVESEMTILFSDIRSFTALSEAMSPEQTFRFLNAYLHRAGPIIRAHDGFVDKYIGDALMGLFPNAAHTAVDAAIDMQRSVGAYNGERARAGDPPIAIGVGLHRGMLMLGAIGESERIETTVIADAVNVASRTESLTKQFGAPVIATEAVISALAQPHDYRLRPLGEVVVYGASRGTHMFEVFDGDAPELLLNKVRTLDDYTAGLRAFTDGNFATARSAFVRVVEVSPNDRTAAYFAEQSRLLAETAPVAAWDGRIRMEVK
jgi:class 3 adenylate cyclase